HAVRVGEVHAVGFTGLDVERKNAFAAAAIRRQPERARARRMATAELGGMSLDSVGHDATSWKEGEVRASVSFWQARTDRTTEPSPEGALGTGWKTPSARPPAWRPALRAAR